MTILQPSYSKKESARRGNEIYERDIRSRIEAAHEGEFVAIDIETGAYELDKDDYTATERLLAHTTDTQIWLRRVSHSTTYRL